MNESLILYVGCASPLTTAGMTVAMLRIVYRVARRFCCLLLHACAAGPCSQHGRGEGGRGEGEGEGVRGPYLKRLVTTACMVQQLVEALHKPATSAGTLNVYIAV